MFDLPAVRKTLDARGWASASGTLKDVRMAASMGGFAESPMNRAGAKSVLRPHTADAAPARSISAVYGLDAQPLHTDGAHLPTPPDVIVLYAPEPSPTPTVVWTQTRPGSYWRALVPEEVRYGVFTVRGNGSSFLASAFDGTRLRFDPVCMSPADDYATGAVRFFCEARQQVHVHEWSEGNSLLFIDNRRSLHAREALAADAETRRIERVAYQLQESQ